MGIPESQLDSWSHQGSVTNSSNTYNVVKNVLTGSGVPYASRDYEVFLQGSYGNDTNIYAESDVDIVIALNDSWQRDIDKLAADDQAAYKAWVTKADYDHVQFKADVVHVLQSAYGNDVQTAGDKAIAIAARGNRRKTDVIVATQFRRYRRFKSSNDQLFTPGICFWNKRGERIVNHPKLHSTNLTTKHQATDQWLKPMVRILKNLRGKMVSDGSLSAGIAPSYYIEGLLYNVPNDRFRDSYEHCFVNALNWIRFEANTQDLVCANEQYYLLRESSHVCWNPASGETFLNAMAKYWRDWK